MFYLGLLFSIFVEQKLVDQRGWQVEHHENHKLNPDKLVDTVTSPANKNGENDNKY